MSLPNTTDDDGQRPLIFDPALKHFAQGFRSGDPVIEDPGLQAYWFDTRRSAIEHILGIIAPSEWAQHLILRGGVPMSYWYSGKAREPRDIDWVFHPPEQPIEPTFGDFLGFLKYSVSQNPHGSGLKFDAKEIESDTIWAYERADGRRVSIPWKAEGLPAGVVQMDIVFEEPMPQPPIQLIIPTLRGRFEFQAASKELSLAWKLIWLLTDSYPQGKDLYDAVLLAEDIKLEPSLLQNVFQRAEYQIPIPISANVIRANLNWDEFLEEYPSFKGDPTEWLDRLENALGTEIINVSNPNQTELPF